MIIDPSLAKGLRRSFWQYTTDRAIEARGVLVEIYARHKGNRPFSQKAFRRFVDEILQNTPASTLILTKLEGRRQFIACMFLDNIGDHEVNEWHEHVLGGYKFIFSRDRMTISGEESRARIGEHAVQRLFQRGGVRSTLNGKFDFGAYAIDIKNAIAWAEVLWLIPSMFNGTGKTILSLFAPTPSGAFVAQLSSEGLFWVNYRTFIALDQMFVAQRDLWAELRAIETDVGLHTLGLRYIACPSIHSPTMRTLVRIRDVMDRFPQITGYAPEVSSE